MNGIMISAGLSSVLLLGSAPSSARDSWPPPIAEHGEATQPEIIVTGFTKPFKLTGHQLVRAQRAFAAARAEFAPASQLYFRVTAKDRAGIEGLDMYLKNGDTIIDLPLDAQSRFVLPPLNGNGWALFANRADKALTVKPVVLSPGTSELHRRLGDLRLQCRIIWAMSGSETPIMVRAMFAAAGGCNSGRFAYYVNTEQAISRGEVSSGSIRLPIKLWGSHSYAVPIGERKMPNNALVNLQPL